MKTLKTKKQLKENLTTKEFGMLESIISNYDISNNMCYDYKLKPTEKGIVANLIKKGLIYNSVDEEVMGLESNNFFPSDDVLDIYGLEHY